MLHLKKVFRPTSNPVITIIAAFSLLTLYGCGKEDLTDQSTAVPTEEINLRNEGDGIIDPSAALAILDDITYSSISVDASIGGLQFSDETTAAQTLNTLELAHNAYQEEIQSSISGLSEEEIDELDIDDAFILQQFEATANFSSSLRSQEEDQMETFLSQEELDENNDPSDDFAYAGPDHLKTVLNAVGEIKIGNTVSKIMPDGGNYTITDGDMETLEFLRTSPDFESIQQRNNIKVVDAPVDQSIYSCHPKRTKKAVHYYNEGWKKYRANISLRVRNYSFLWFNKHFVSARLFSYKKKLFFGQWKKHYTEITNKMAGSVYYSLYVNSNCAIWEFNQDTQQWEIVGYEPCVTVRDCGGGGVFLDVVQTVDNWTLNLKKNFNQRISVSDMDPEMILKARYHWMGNVYELAMYP